jgi:hypothetical protein
MAFSFEEPDSIQANFERFHYNHPEVYEILVRKVRSLFGQGVRRYGIGMLCEDIRWHDPRVKRTEGYKINNNYRARYVRLIVAAHPEWEDFFEQRRLRSK